MQTEWLETNGIGGFSSSTTAGMNTRRYHGLLTAATKPPLGRMLLLSKLEETLIVDGKHFDLSTNQYAGGIYPRGLEYLTGFKLAPSPIWTWEAGGVGISKTLSMAQGENCVTVTYEIEATSRQCKLEVRPLIAFRNYHALTRANDAINRTVENEPGLASIEPYPDLPRLYFAHNADDLDPHGYWYYNFEYVLEKERGLDFTEDLYNPFTLRFSTGRAVITASTEPRRTEVQRPAASLETGLIPTLTKAASQFIVKRGHNKSVIAGYHWFADWGRDTMISLPGLTLATGRPELARDILLEFAQHMDQGMIPNRFPDDSGPPEYNTVDATLWFVEAVRAYVEYTNDSAFVRDHLYDQLREIIDWHIRGTRYGIHADSDGLLAAQAHLTWMDTRTPRPGKAVEVQALWYNALRTIEDFAKTFEDTSTRTTTKELASRAGQSFNAKFWNEQTGCLYDVINDMANDASIRPNQVIAASLNYSMLSQEKIRQILDVVERELLTPYGLRTLSHKDPRYCPRYEGGVEARDTAYHQGTVWPWLMGPYITAFVKVNNRSAAACARAKTLLEAFIPHFNEAGLGQVSEIFDGDPPHTPRGCIAQAWSVAELLRAAAQTATQAAGLA